MNQKTRFTALFKQTEVVGNLEEGSLEFVIERHLQDENETLSQLIKDHTPGTHIHFALLLEDFVTSYFDHEWNQELSWTAQKKSLELLHPVHLLYSQRPISITTKSLIKESHIPETFHITNLRSRSSSTALLQVLRQSFSPLFSAPELASDSLEFNFLEKPNFKSAHQYSLTFLHELPNVYQSGESTTLDPKEIKSFLVSWEETQDNLDWESITHPSPLETTPLLENSNERDLERMLLRKEVPPIRVAISQTAAPPGPPIAVWFLAFLAYFLIFLVGWISNQKFVAIFFLMLLHIFNSVSLYMLSQPTPEFNIA